MRATMPPHAEMLLLLMRRSSDAIAAEAATRCLMMSFTLSRAPPCYERHEMLI